MSSSARHLTIEVTSEIQTERRIREVLQGLTSSPKRFPMKYLYMGAVDHDRLFEAIASMPDYHLAEGEEGLLRTHIARFVRELGPTELLDIGCGCGLRADVLLEAVTKSGKFRRYIGLDIAQGELERWLNTVARRYASLDVRGVVGDFEYSETITAIPPAEGPRLAVMLGQTLGNLAPDARVSFLRLLWSVLDPGDPLIIGLDFTADLEAALPGYDDADGRNAAFSLNALDEINRLLNWDLKHADSSSTSRQTTPRGRSSAVCWPGET